MPDNPLLLAAGRFHGHIGPFLAIGLKIGLVANERLGRAPLEMAATVRVAPRPPQSCVVDGIQFSTGCTMGKGNIEVEPEGQAISARFVRGSKGFTVTVLDSYIRRMESDLEGKPEKAIIDYSFKIMDTQPTEIFEVSE